MYVRRQRIQIQRWFQQKLFPPLTSKMAAILASLDVSFIGRAALMGGYFAPPPSPSGPGPIFALPPPLRPWDWANFNFTRKMDTCRYVYSAFSLESRIDQKPQ